MTGFLSMTFWGAKKHSAGLSVTASPTSISSSGIGSVTSSVITATPSGGTAPYTYSWALLPGSHGITITAPTSAATTTSATLSSGDFLVAFAVCTVTDHVGTVVASNQVSIQFSATVTPGVLTTMTLVNTSGSTQAANFITPVFGHSFKKGDIPSGTAPIFSVAGTVQPFSWGCQNYWSDGSLKHASFAFRCSASILGSGSVSVTISSGGTAPTTSARTLTEVYAQSLQVNMVGVVTLSGTYTGTVASNGFNKAQAVYMDGDAGKWWRIWTNAVKSGSAHGGIEVYHYIAALTDNSGNLGGFRYVPRIMQPWYNVNSPALNTYAANLSWQHGGGPTTVNWNWPFVASTFTTTAASPTATLSSGTHNYYQGQVDGGVNSVPGVFTVTGGALDTAITAGTIYWVTNNTGGNSPPDNTHFQVFVSPGQAGTGGGGQITFNGNATGTMVFTPTPHILPLQSIFDLDNEGQPKFFQGTGSLATDNTVMTQFNCEYLVSTGLIQPFDTSYTGKAFGGTINDNADVLPMGWNYNWTPTTTGPIALSGIGTAGGHDYIGPVTQYTARHFYNQSKLSARIIRQQATCSDFFGCSTFRDSVTGNYVNLSGNSYTGMPAVGQEGRIVNVSLTLTLPAGITDPPSFSSAFNVGEPNGAHKPDLAFWAGLIFADPHFIDLAVEEGIGSVTNCGVVTRNPAAPLTAAHGIVGWTNVGGMRACAWQLRGLIHGAIVAPQNHPDGSQSCDMLRDYANNNLNYMYNAMTSAKVGSYFFGIGRYNPYAVPDDQMSPVFDASAGGFQGLYMTNVVPMGIKGLESASALSLMNYWSGSWGHCLNTFSGYYIYVQDDFAVFYDSGGNSNIPIPSDSYYGVSIVSFGATFLNWTNSNPYFNVDAWGVNPLLNGDMVMFDGSGQAVPTNFTAQVPYYVRDISGLTFNLAATPGGTAITTPSTGHQQAGAGSAGGGSGPYAMSKLQSWALATTGNVAAGGTAYDSYCATGWSGFSSACAMGATGYNTVGGTGYSLITDAKERMTVNGNIANFVNGPTFLVKTSL